MESLKDLDSEPVTQVGDTIADLLISYLEALGVEYVFGVPGGNIEPLYNALARSERRGTVRSMVARHETGAAFMADGYATRSGRLGVCCATTGPGTTNLVTGVASAYANLIPMLVITAQTALPTFGRGAIQESSCTGINTVAILAHCTRYSSLVSHPDQFEHKLVSALMTAYSSPPGPVHLSIPLDVLRSGTLSGKPRFDLVKLLQRPQLVDRDTVTSCCRLLERSGKIVFVIGEGAAEAIGDVLTLASRLRANLITTPHGKGLVSPYHPHYYGVVGFAGHTSARKLLEDPELDTVVCVGTRMGEWASNGWDTTLLLNARMIHIDEQDSNFTFTPMARLHVRGRLLTVFEQLNAYFRARPAEVFEHGTERRMQRRLVHDDDDGFNAADVPIKPQRLMRDLPGIFPPCTRYFADSGNSFAWAIHYLHPYDRRIMGHRNTNGALFRACLEFASMGWAIGSAVGSALAQPGEPVVCITGDGAMLMSGQEITVAVEAKLPVIFVVLNDAGLGMVRHGQRLGGAEQVAADMTATDFAAMARAMGADGFVIRSPDELLALDGEAMCQRSGPTLLDVHVDMDAVPPIKMRIQSLQR